VLTAFLDGSTLPYYLLAPPSPILINVGRQLFVDDFLIESSHNLKHTFHQAEVHPEPLISPGDDEVSTFVRDSGLTVVSYFAAPYSDGVWWDAYQRRFRAWLLGGPNALKLAESDDGIEWRRATLRNGSEIIMEVPQGRDSGAVWIDFQTDDESARYKMSHFNFTDKKNWLYTSHDGLEWPSYWDPAARTAHYSSKPDVPTGDRTTFFRDPFRKKWVWSLRDVIDLRESGGLEFNRVRRYAETADLIGMPEATAANTPWMIAHPDDDDGAGKPAQLYNVDAIAYESLMVFMLTIWTGNERLDVDTGTAASKSNAVHVGFSRDGFHVSRPSAERRRPFIGPGEPESWNEGNVQSVAAGITIVGPEDQEELFIYFSARENRLVASDRLERRGRMGLARLRRDGFASLDAGEDRGMLTTRLLRFDHADGFLFVNTDARGGELRVEVIDENWIVVPGLSLDECIPLTVDSTRKMVAWTSTQSVGRMRGARFRLRFNLRSARLFSFWVSPGLKGSSNGFLAAGGPGYLGYQDNVVQSPTGISSDSSLPAPFALLSNAPNPFSDETRIRYRLVWPQTIELSVYDLLGRRVVTLDKGDRQAGLHEVRLSGAGLAPGVYLCRLTSSGREDTIRIVRSR